MKFQNLEGVQSVAVVGATGLVGQEFISLLNEHKIKIPKIKLLASGDSAGEKIACMGTEITVEELDHDSFDGVEVAFFSVPKDVTKKYVPHAVDAGALVIDDSSVYRMDPKVPLIVPEVNGHVLRNFDGQIISVPNCTTTPLVLCLQPLVKHFGVSRIVTSTYQSVSGAGQEAYAELSEQTISLLNARETSVEVFPHRIAFNCLPQIGMPVENGNSEEEEKMIKETRKILGLDDLKVSATCVRVPTFFGHGLTVNVELKKEFGKVEEIRELFSQTEGVKVIDHPEQSIYPTSVEASGADHAFIGRIRRDHSLKSGLNFWVICDNLRKGASLNALQILDTLYRYRRMS